MTTVAGVPFGALFKLSCGCIVRRGLGPFGPGHDGEWGRWYLGRTVRGSYPCVLLHIENRKFTTEAEMHPYLGHRTPADYDMFLNALLESFS